MSYLNDKPTKYSGIRFDTSGSIGYLSGYADNLLIYNRALNNNEMLELSRKFGTNTNNYIGISSIEENNDTIRNK